MADSSNNRIRKITPGGVVSTLAGSTEGYHDALGTEAEFSNPSSVAVDSSGFLYVADQGNHCIRKIIIATREVTTIAGSGTYGHHDATGTEARFNEPSNMTVDSSGNLYVADTENHRIRRITSAGVVTTIAGTGDTAEFDNPISVAVDSSGILYVADANNHRIRKIEYK